MSTCIPTNQFAMEKTKTSGRKGSNNAQSCEVEKHMKWFVLNPQKKIKFLFELSDVKEHSWIWYESVPASSLSVPIHFMSFHFSFYLPFYINIIITIIFFFMSAKSTQFLVSVTIFLSFFFFFQIPSQS